MTDPHGERDFSEGRSDDTESSMQMLAYVLLLAMLVGGFIGALVMVE